MVTFDSKTIVMMAENGHSVEIDGKKIQMTIVQEAVEAKPNYSDLIGKWVKCVDVGESVIFSKDKWYPCVKIDDDLAPIFIDDNGRENGVTLSGTPIRFDLSNPLDHNPDDVRVFDVPSEIKISQGSLSLNLHFSEHQALWYNKGKHCYAVIPTAKTLRSIPCIATECKFEDLQEGGLFFATNDEKPDLTNLVGYNFLRNDKRFVWTNGRDVNVLGEYKYTHYFKITPKP